MKLSTLLFVAFSLFIFSACQSASDSREQVSGDSLPAPETHGHGHHHGDANAHMHQSSVEELIQRFDDPGRDAWQQPGKVIERMGGVTGRKIADLGAGSGYFTFRLADAGALVLALDINTEFLDHINQKAAGLPTEVANRIETRFSEPERADLAPGEVEMVLTVNTYHHFEDRIRYFNALRTGIMPGGKLFVVDFKPGDLPFGPPAAMKIAPEDIADELVMAGFKPVEIDANTLEHQVIIEAVVPMEQ